MQKLSENELVEINGGGWRILVGIVAIAALAAGIIDGYLRPKKCN